MNPSLRLIIGLEADRLTSTEIELFSEYEFGGIILFDRNARGGSGSLECLAEIKKRCKLPPLIAVDFEGGRVQRLKGFLGNIDEPAAYRDDFAGLDKDIAAVGARMRQLGINLNLAPVADLTYDPPNPALSGRTFSGDAGAVAEYCRRFYQAFAECGIACCLKHFPGLGSAANDPHLRVAISCVPRERIETHDLVPFRAGIADGIEFMMTTHMLISAIDDRLATFSPRVCNLARNLGFEGILLTDDLSMGAVRSLRPLEELVLEALCAGHDMALICHDNQRYPATLKYLRDNIDRLVKSGHEKAMERIGRVTKALAVGSDK